MEEKFINQVLSIMGYALFHKNTIKKLSNNIFYVKAAFGNQYAADVLCDQIEEFKANYPQIIEYVKITMDDDGTRDYVNDVRIKIVFEFKDMSKIDQLTACLKVL